MRVLFTTFFDSLNYGVQVLAACAQKDGHDVGILQMKTAPREVVDTVPDFPCQLYAYIDRLLITSIRSELISPIERRLFAQVITAWKPDVIGISMMGVVQHILPDVLPIVRSAAPLAFIVAGGIGPTLDPTFFLNTGVDAVIRGEGEKALPQLLQCLQTKRPWRDLDNIGYEERGHIFLNPAFALSKSELEELPHPISDPGLFLSIENNEHSNLPLCMTDSTEKTTSTATYYNLAGSRGCLGSCTYCSAGALLDLYRQFVPSTPRLRKRNLWDIFEEISEAKSRGEEKIRIVDDFFIYPKDELTRFFEKYKTEISLPFVAFFHPSQINGDDNFVKLLFDAGLEVLAFGLQSADADFCKKIYMRNTYSKNYSAIYRSVMKHAGTFMLHFIMGNPLETEAVFQKNLDFIAKFPFDPSRRSILTLGTFALSFFPGAKICSNYPGIEKKPRDLHDWHYKSALLAIRHLVTKETFQKIVENSTYKENITDLTRLKQAMQNDIHRYYVFSNAKRLKDRDIYFWGCGDIYKLRKHLFFDTNPLGIIVDSKYHHQNSVDGLKIYSPEEVFEQNKTPIVVFSREQGNIYRRITEQYGNDADVVSCVF